MVCSSFYNCHIMRIGAPICNIKLGRSFRGHSMSTECNKIENGMIIRIYQSYYRDRVIQEYNSVTNITKTHLHFDSNWNYGTTPAWFKKKCNLIDAAVGVWNNAVYTSDELDITISHTSLQITVKINEKNINFLNHYENLILIKKYKHTLSIVRDNIKNSVISNWVNLSIENATIILNDGITQNITY